MTPGGDAFQAAYLAEMASEKRKEFAQDRDPERAVHSRGTRVKRGMTDMVVNIYEMKESELKTLESTTQLESDKNWLVGALCALFGLAATWATAESIQHEGVFFGLLFTAVALSFYFHHRTTKQTDEKAEVLKEIKGRVFESQLIEEPLSGQSDRAI